MPLTPKFSANYRRLLPPSAFWTVVALVVALVMAVAAVLIAGRYPR